MEDAGMEANLQVPTTAGEGTKNQERELEKVFEYVRPDLNIEKHADFIFAPAHSKNLHKPRSRTWIETLPDGTKVKATIYLDPVRGKTPTTRTRKVYLALQKILEDKGWNDDERTHFSLYDVSQTIGWKWGGKNTVKQIRDELFILGGVPITWQYSYVDENGHKVGLLDMFHFLDSLKIVEKKDRATNQLFLSLSSFRFHEEIRKNLKANRTKPTNLTALEIQGEIASVLYARLDIVLANKLQYERNSAPLFSEDMQLQGGEYRYPSGRKRNLEKAIKELEGKPISTGALHLSIEKTADGKDWKLVAKKEPFPEKPRVFIGQRVAPANPPEAVPYLAEDIARTIGHQEVNHRLYTLLCTTYSQDMLYQALSEWKADGGKEARNPRGYFMAILHRLAHLRGKLWMNKNCLPDCKYRPTPAAAEYNQANEREARKQAITACTQCDDNGWKEKPDENGGYAGLTRCTHQPLQPTEHVT